MYVVMELVFPIFILLPLVSKRCTMSCIALTGPGGHVLQLIAQTSISSV